MDEVRTDYLVILYNSPNEYDKALNKLLKFIHKRDIDTVPYKNAPRLPYGNATEKGGYCLYIAENSRTISTYNYNLFKRAVVPMTYRLLKLNNNIKLHRYLTEN